MGDPLSTIRQVLAAFGAAFIDDGGRTSGSYRSAMDDALAACDALEAELLTPDEARAILDALPQELWWWGGPSESQEAWLAKLERRAGDIDPDATPFDKPKMEPKTSD